MKRSDVILGMTLIMVAIWGWYETSTWAEIKTVGISVKAYPRAIFSFLGICGAIIGIRGYLSKDRSRTVWRWSTFLPVVFALAVYAIIIQYLGFLPSTIIFLISTMYLFGERRWKIIATVPLLGSYLIYLIFVKVLMVPMH